ncbi:type II toxin-antitoxin system ParD family antitoxin [Glaciecola sp. 1036]|uniref:type II toxin-antitoxin system ParD family antitoxin n=1 Tax=Alteromonadaceae TaxID=72275 RepID=UPI003D021634
MANTSLSLGEHWEKFIKLEIQSGRYGSASEVVRDALRNLEEKKSKLRILQSHLEAGSKQAESKDFIYQSPKEILQEFKNEREKK